MKVFITIMQVEDNWSFTRAEQGGGGSGPWRSIGAVISHFFHRIKVFRLQSNLNLIQKMCISNRIQRFLILKIRIQI